MSESARALSERAVDIHDCIQSAPEAMLECEWLGKFFLKNENPMASRTFEPPTIYQYKKEYMYVSQGQKSKNNTTYRSSEESGVRAVRTRVAPRYIAVL